ncbi:hypothetical protein [Granulosicoccus antarcticus]|nr:hypothetical protein [Granulosicoccus antarcticus]
MKTRLLLVPIALLLLSGCVTGTRSIDIGPSSTTLENRSSSKGTIYIANIEDNRQFEQKPASPSTPSVDGTLSAETPESLATYIGRQRSGYGKALGSVKLPEGETVQQKMRDALTSSLQSNGYIVTEESSAPLQLDVDINQFWAWFSPGFWSVSFSGIIESTLTFTGIGENTVLAVDGNGLNRGQVASNANWALAYSRTFDDFLENLKTAMETAGL